jgi:CRISPR-associated protein Csm4
MYRDGDPPVLISDGYPGDFLPLPLSYIFCSRDLEWQKQMRMQNYVTRDEFDSVRYLKFCPVPHYREFFVDSLVLHASISRMTGTTKDIAGEASLYEVGEIYPEKDIDHISVYLKIKDGWEKRICDYFRQLSLSGYGKDKSTGKGDFELSGSMEPFGEFKNDDEFNGFVSLSHYVPSRIDPKAVLYHTITKYGRLGEHFAITGNPFKVPLIMLRPGAVAKTDCYPKEFYGQLIEGLVPERPEVVQYAYAFTVPIILPADMD